MPNWCINELKIKGKGEELKAFKEKAKGEDTEFSLNNFIPIPEELLKYSSPPFKEEWESEEEFGKRIERFKNEYGAKDWYDWCVNNWGTKWDVVAEIVCEHDGEVEYHFDSAWAPPISGLEKISKLFPGLGFELFYFEPGMCFGGVARMRNGEVFDDYYEMEDAVNWLKFYDYELWKEFYGDREEEV